MKKLWYLFLTLFLAFGIAACEDKGDIAPEPEPEPGPTGPTEAPKGVVTDLAYVRDGYQSIELSWADPDEEYPITAYTIVATPADTEAESLTYTVSADDITVVDGKQTYVLEELEQPEYSLNILVANAYAQQKSGATLADVEPFTLVSMTMPTVAIVEQDGAMYLRFSNVNGSRNIFDHLTFTMKDGEENVVFEGEAAASDEELATALEEMKANTTPVDVLIELEEGVTLDETASYNVEYTIFAHAAYGGVVGEGVIEYEEVLDMQAEPASVEGVAENLGVGVEVQPLFFHIYSYGSAYLTNLNQAVITVPQIYEGEGTKLPKYREYRIYVGSCEEDSELYKDADGKDGIYAYDDSRWYDVESVNPDAISELNPNSEKSQNLYRDEWAGQAIKTIDLVHKVYPSYIRVEAYDVYGRMVAMGHRLAATFSVEASQPDIQAHQPKWELLPNNDGLTYTLKASHLSAARAYARSVEWTIKDESGEVIATDKVEGGSYYSDGSSLRHCADLITKEWTVEAKNFIVGRKYSVDYTIDYIPVYTIPGMDDQQPLDYDPETGEFTPTPDGVVANATGMDHDIRILRDYLRDENGNVKFRTRSKDDNGDTVYAFKHETGDYRGWIAWGEKSVVLTSAELVEAGATLENEVTAPEENGEPGEYKVELQLEALKQMNTVKVSWNAFAVEDITKVIINDGTEDIEVTEGGDYAWEESDGRASIVIEGIVGGPDVLMSIDVYAGEELLGEAEDFVSIFTLDNWQAPVFEWVRLQDGQYKFVAKNLANVNYAFSHNIYEDVANSEKTQSVIRLYDSSNQLVQTLYATSLRDWWTHLWSCYARWALNFQDAWDEWVWVGQLHDSKGANQREVPASAIPAGEYRIEYELGYVVNKNGFWSTTDAANPTEATSRPDVTVHTAACVAFPPQVQGTFSNENRSENVLYCENRLQLDPDNNGNIDSNYQKQQLVKVFVKTGEAQLNVSASTDPQIWLTAAIDEGTTKIYGNNAGEKSVNGLFEAVKLSWTIENCTPTKVVIAYDNQTIEVTDGSTSKVVEGIESTSVEFTVTAYNGSEALVSKTITSDVYTTSTMEQVRFNTTYDTDNDNWQIFVENGLSGKEWAFAKLTFNFYEESDTNFASPLFDGDVTKDLINNANPSTVQQWSSFGYATYRLVDNSDYDDGITAEYTKSTRTFTGIGHSTNYIVKYELTVLPMIYSHSNDAGTMFYHKKMLYDNPQTITGTYAMATTAPEPDALYPVAKRNGYQAVTVSWHTIAGATGYEVYVGEEKVAEAGADATSAEVTGLTEARNYVFTVKTLGVTASSDTAETEIFTLCDYNPSFEIVKQDDDSWKLNMYKLSYAGGSFRSIAFALKEKGSDTVLYSETGTEGEVGCIALSTLKSWLSHYYIPWTSQTDSRWSTAEGKKLEGVEFKAGTTYVVEYTATLVPGITAWEQEDYVGDYTWSLEQMQAGTHYYFADLLTDWDNLPTTTATMEFTTAQ